MGTIRAYKSRRDIDQRFEEKIERDPNSGCWLWAAANDGRFGYGGFFAGELGFVKAHRFAYERFRCEPIPIGMEIDHLCCTPACVNPDHLEAVTRGENMRRSPKIGLTLGGIANGARQRAKSKCPKGHSYDDAIVSRQGWRRCRPCFYTAEARRRASRRTAMES